MYLVVERRSVFLVVEHAHADLRPSGDGVAHLADGLRVGVGSLQEPAVPAIIVNIVSLSQSLFAEEKPR